MLLSEFQVKKLKSYSIPWVLNLIKYIRTLWLTMLTMFISMELKMLSMEQLVRFNLIWMMKKLSTIYLKQGLLVASKYLIGLDFNVEEGTVSLGPV
jgi:hypothetical protein